MFNEYIYVDDTWELFGSATVDLALDSTPTANSTNPVTSGGVKTALDGKQNTLTFDTTPTEYSTNPVTSGGIKTALNGKQDTLAFDTTPTANSTKPVTSGGIKTALDGKQNTLTFDTAPTVNSTKPVTSGGIKTALNAKQDKLIFDSVPTASSTNPVTSGGVKSALNDIEMQLTAATKSPLKANTVAAMSDTTKTYIYTGSETGYTFGNWYYYNGSSWTDGGIYNATAFETDKTLTIENMAADSKAVGDLKEALSETQTALETKADKDGTVASAEQLLSDVGTEDKAPYLFRVTPYDSTRVDEEVVGCTVGWNQLALNVIKSLSHTWDADGSYYYTLTNNSGIKIEVGHVYFAGAKITRTISGNNFLGLSVTPVIFLTLENEAPNGYAYQITKVTSATTDSYIRFNNYSGKRGFNAGDSAEYDDLMVIDLTAWFGSTIADYALSLETATAGSGVAWIKALLPGGYIPYSAPTLKSVSGLSAHVMRGFNQWDEEWEVGSLVAETLNSKNYIPVVPNTTYYISCGTASTYPDWYWYDADKNLIGITPSSANRTFTTPKGCHFIKFRLNVSYGATYKHDICINLSDPAKNGTYEPYSQTTYALDSDLTLRGILKMDSDHRVYADGDVYKADGTVVRKYAEVDLGDLTYIYQSSSARFDVSGLTLTSKPYTRFEVPDVICTIYKPVIWDGNGTSSSGADMAIMFDGSNLRIRNTSFTDEATFKTAMSGVKLVYAVNAPSTEEADPYTSPQICEPGGTEEYVYAEGGSGVLVGHNSRYQKNLKGELERVSVAVPTAPSANGTYSLKATVTSSGVTYGWVAD